MKSQINNDQISLFKYDEPLAFKLRPKSANDFIGQSHLFGEGGVLANYLKNNAPYSVIFWGPPGCGKTTAAFLIRENSSKDFTYISGASTSVSDLREIINKSKMNPGRTILFLDEIHRLAKNQQDVLLESLESGILTLIGTTTENPLVSLTRALHSRVRVFEFKPHIEEDLEKIVIRAVKLINKNISPEAIKYLVSTSSGDARRLLFNLDEVIKSAKGEEINEKEVKAILENAQLQIGADQDSHYNYISALQKSMRGSDPDAALYWLARLLAGGADPVLVARRILVTASEDIGLADNNALNIAINAYLSAQFLGMPEARIPLSQAVIYLSNAPKSNSSIISIDKAMKDVKELPPYQVPLHIRNLGGQGYKYPHDYKEGKVEQEYLPKELKGKKYL
jgi:putative ATPase